MNRAKILYFVLASTQIATINLYAADPKQGDTPLIAFMSYNIRRGGIESKKERLWSNRMERVIHIIKEEKPDILGIQEAKKNQIEDLLSKLCNYQAIGNGRGASYLGWGEDEHCPIFYNTETMFMIDDKTCPLNESESHFWFLRPQSTGFLPRICTLAKFKIKSSEKKILVNNLHLDHMFAEAQINNLKAALEHMKKFDEGDNTPSIIMGDFNTPITEEIKELLSDYDPADEVTKQRWGPSKTQTGWDNTREERKKIDHICIEKGKGTVEEFSVISSEKPFPSDHRPIIADIILHQ